MESIGRDVWRIRSMIGNLYLVRDRDNWAVVDTGTPGMEKKIISAAESVFGAGASPDTILLTHGHYDHSGSAGPLIDYWRAPIYAHPLESPYLLGRSEYPPTDPTVGGFYAFASRFMPNPRYDIHHPINQLPEGGSVPGLPSWRWFATPGHTPGHVSFLNETSGILLVGDAVITANMDSAIDTLTQRPQVSRPPASVTTDWESTAASTRRIAELDFDLLAAGHGNPMRGAEMRRQLRQLAERYPAPLYGRYAAAPARTNEQGIVSVPPPVPDPLPRRLALAGVVAGAVAGTVWMGRSQLGLPGSEAGSESAPTRHRAA